MALTKRIIAYYFRINNANSEESMLVCTFAGHRQVFAADVAQKARDALERLVEIDRELTFYTGGMGEFDSLCAAAVRRLRAGTRRRG